MSSTPKSIKKYLFRLYLSLPGSRFVFSLVKMIMIPPYKVRKYLRFRGSFRLKIGHESELKLMNYGNTIENELFWLGTKGWEGLTLQAWKNLSEKAQVIFDVGANTGLFALISAKVNPSAEIHAFEPLSLGMKRLKKNVSLNQLSINTWQIALADEDGQGMIFVADTISGTFDQATLNKERSNQVSSTAEIISTKRISSFIEENNLKRIDLMKIDVETYEPNVLRGMGSYLKMFFPTILIEILNEKVGTEVESILAGMNYQFYLIDERHGIVATRNLLPRKRGNNFLLVDKGNTLMTEMIAGLTKHG